MADIGNLRAARSAAFAFWLLAAGSAVYWALKFAPQPVAPAAAVQARAADAGAGHAAPPAPDAALLAQILGAGLVPAAAAAAAEPPPKAPSLNAARFALTGVVRPSAMHQGAGRAPGLALIALDGKPARLYREGTWLEDGVALQSVGPRSVVLAHSMRGPSALTLELSRKRPATSGASSR